MNRLISIIVPVYNVETYLNKCFESIVNQSYKNIEIILVDDGSTDKSGSICDELAKRDNRVAVIHKVNGGLSSARNKGLEAAKGEYILFVDSDDFIKNEMCECLISCCKNKDLIVFGMERVDESSLRVIDKIIPFSSFSCGGIEYLVKMMSGKEKYSLSACRCLYRREFLLQNDIWFKEGILHEDIECLSRIYLMNPSVEVIDRSFYVYLIRQNSITQKKNLTKNAICLKDICYQIYVLSLKSKLKKKDIKIIQNFLCKLYLYAFSICDKSHINQLVDKGFVKRCSTNGITSVKKVFFLLSPFFYWTIVHCVRG